MNQTLLLELNEINFDYVRYYADRGLCPNLRALLDRYSLCETVSETDYDDLEPWIQWVTAHTGKPLSEHQVFRLGDIVNHDIEQIWEQLEKRGIKVGAVSPMNAKNRTSNACFFVPDPWTNTQVSGSYLLKKLYRSISQAVNDNSQSRLSTTSVLWLIVGAMAYARPANYLSYLRFAWNAGRQPWKKAMFLDLLLTDVFVSLMKSKKPEFASLFVNAGAHIQHHYMFNSPAYDGAQKNPSWYVADDQDPLLDVYSLYDKVVKILQDEFADARLIIATGLHQDPHPVTTYYWRLIDHEEYLKKVGVEFNRVLPRMSRDFLIEFEDEAKASAAQEILQSAVAEDGVDLFAVDNRGKDLFVMLTYPHDVGKDFEYRIVGKPIMNFRKDIAFVALKNGQHNGIGYFLDTGPGSSDSAEKFPLAELPARIMSGFA